MGETRKAAMLEAREGVGEVKEEEETVKFMLEATEEAVESRAEETAKVMLEAKEEAVEAKAEETAKEAVIPKVTREVGEIKVDGTSMTFTTEGVAGKAFPMVKQTGQEERHMGEEEAITFLLKMLHMPAMKLVRTKSSRSRAKRLTCFSSMFVCLPSTGRQILMASNNAVVILVMSCSVTS